MTTLFDDRPMKHIQGHEAGEELVKIDKAAAKDGTGPLGKPNP